MIRIIGNPFATPAPKAAEKDRAADLTEGERALVLQVLRNAPLISIEEVLAQLKAGGM
jgi:hypothetical protein